jgi:hypothetical protein
VISAFDNYGLRATWPVARRYQFAVAAKMCDEHRAQWNAAQVIGTDPPTADQVLDVLCHMGQEIEAAATRFRQSIKAPVNLEELREAVYAAAHLFWTQVAYWAAEHREGEEISQLPKEITQLKIWQRYVGPTWQSMTEALSQLPTALATSPEALNQAATRVAVAVTESLQHIGFRHFAVPRSPNSSISSDTTFRQHASKSAPVHRVAYRVTLSSRYRSRYRGTSRPVQLRPTRQDLSTQLEGGVSRTHKR